VRDCYVRDGRRTIVVTDRISAFDRVLGTVPFKGQVLNQLAAHWFTETTAIAPNHVLSVPDPNVTVTRECTPLAAEFVMRGYLTGVTSTSVWRAYEEGTRVFCGHPLPDGMIKNQPLPQPILTPSTKAEKGGHDVSVSKEQLIALGAVTEKDFEEASEMVHALFAHGQKQARDRGLVLADAKYELGRTAEDELVVIDEIHTPDSSRYWFADCLAARRERGEEPRSLDKEYVRRWLSETHGYSGEGAPPPLPDDVRVEASLRYIEAFELITGREFEPNEDPPLDRMKNNLRSEA